MVQLLLLLVQASQLIKVTVGGISIDKTDGINAGYKAISNVASGGTTDTNAANIGDVKASRC